MAQLYIIVVAVGMITSTVLELCYNFVRRRTDQRRDSRREAL